LIPTQEQFEAMTDDEKRERGGEIIHCLDGYKSSLSESCQQTLQNLPPAPGASPTPSS
jgi:hypothetical protein